MYRNLYEIPCQVRLALITVGIQHYTKNIKFFQDNIYIYYRVESLWQRAIFFTFTTSEKSIHFKDIEYNFSYFNYIYNVASLRISPKKHEVFVMNLLS